MTRTMGLAVLPPDEQDRGGRWLFDISQDLLGKLAAEARTGRTDVGRQPRRLLF
jgi:hypothetical protein